MKFIHLGDLHLGKNVNNFTMIEDQRYILNQILTLMEEKCADGILLAGDIYDRSVPSEEAVKVFDEFLTQLAALKKKVFIISGNHDSDERLNFGSTLLQENEIYIAARYDGKVKCVDVSDEYGMVHIWMLPYVKASRVAHYFPQADTSTYDGAFRTVIDSCDINTEERNIIMVHQFVTGRSTETELAGSENQILHVGTIDQITADCFDAFDYVAMGHIHRSQAVERETCRYAGAPLKYSLNKNELSCQKTVPFIILGEKGDISVELLPLTPLREVRHIRGPLQELIQNAVDTEDYIYATLTDENTQLDALARLQEVYPRMMKLDYDNQTSRALAQMEGTPDIEGKSFSQLVTEFFLLYHGQEPNQKEWEIIEAVAEETGVI